MTKGKTIYHINAPFYDKVNKVIALENEAIRIKNDIQKAIYKIKKNIVNTNVYVINLIVSEAITLINYIDELQQQYKEKDIKYVDEARNNLSFQQENEKQKKILDILKPYVRVEKLSGKYLLRVGGGDYQKWFFYEITKEQYELIKEVEEEND